MSEILGKFNETGGSFTYLGMDWVMVSVDALQEMVRTTLEIFGTGAHVIWYLIGVSAGKSFTRLTKEVEEGLSHEGFLEHIAKTLSSTGWGKMQIVSFDESNLEFKVRVVNSPFARNGLRSETPSCFYIKGFVKGALEEITGKKLECTETMCKAKGDPYCEFHSHVPAHTSPP